MDEAKDWDLAGAVAERLRQSRDEVTHEWLHRLIGRLDSASYPSISVQHLRELAPSAVEWLVDRVISPRAAPDSLREWFREVVELQRSRGRRAGEVARDVELLADIAFDLLHDVLAESGRPVPPLQVTEVDRRLRDALVVLNLWVVDDFEEAGRRERREIRGRVEEFVRTVTHELKNPLGAAELALQMLEDGEIVASPGERERYREMVARNLKRGRVLLDDLRTRALPDLEGEAKREWIRLATVLQDVFAEVLPPAEIQGVRLGADEIPESWEVPAREAKLILMNLAGNAVKYADPSKPDRWVQLRARPAPKGGLVQIEVEDNGIGIAPELQERVFERMFRVHPEDGNGTGLGLAIARETAEEIGGGIWLDSEPGRGSTFTAALPVHDRSTGDGGAPPS